jgi:hypothetical protein
MRLPSFQQMLAPSAARLALNMLLQSFSLSYELSFWLLTAGSKIVFQMSLETKRILSPE